MNRSLLKLVGVLLVVGALPFAASIWIVGDLLPQVVSLGLNPQVQEHLADSAEAHRQFIESEKQAHSLAADLLCADPLFRDVLGRPTTTREELAGFAASYLDVHPRLIEIRVASADLSTDVRAGDSSESEGVIRTEERPVAVGDGEFVVTLTFTLPARFIEELENLGRTLDTFRALETVKGELTHDMRRAHLYLAGGVALVALILGTWLARRTTSRLARIASAAGQVAAGDLEVRVDDRGRDELGALARQFNSMVEEIRASHERVAYLQRLSAWQEIARRLAHEIKNPLTPILLSVQQLHETYDSVADQPDRFRVFLDDTMEIVGEEIGTLRELVREFSEFARLPKVETTPEVLAQFVGHFLRTNPQLTERVQIRLEISETCLKTKIALDHNMMRRALFNLVENAADAAEEADRDSPVMTFRISEGEGRLVLVLLDNGPGVPTEKLETIFDPYFTTKAHGTGLGLPIVKKIILDHGGRIAVSNRPTGGFEVTMSFPVEEN